MTLSYYDFLWYGKTAWTLFMGLWMPLSYMKVMNIDHARSLFIATSMKSDRYEQWSWLEAMNIDRYDHCSYWFMHECAVHAMKGYWSCMKTVDHSYEQALIMHDNVHIHVIMNIVVTPKCRATSVAKNWSTRISPLHISFLTMHMCEVTLVGKIPRCTDIQQAIVSSRAHCIGTTWPLVQWQGTTKYRSVNYPIRDSLNVRNQS